jgi:hypothetical protein
LIGVATLTGNQDLLLQALETILALQQGNSQAAEKAFELA